MRWKKGTGMILSLCLCAAAFGTSCGKHSAKGQEERAGSQPGELAKEPEDAAGGPSEEQGQADGRQDKPAEQGLEDLRCQEETAADQDAQTALAGASSKIAEIKELPSYSIVDMAGWDETSVHALFYAQEISDEIYAKINGCSYRQNEDIALSELRYLRVLHMGMDGETRVGELIVHESVSQDILEIMEALYWAGYPIEKMRLVEYYEGDDVKSMEDNNTSAFNYRTIAGTDKRSNHSYGMAIDINPLYNPYVKVKSDGSVMVSPQSGSRYADRETDFPYKIERGGLCYNLFVEHGFTWGGDWSSVKDYQHFEKSGA